MSIQDTNSDRNEKENNVEGRDQELIDLARTHSGEARTFKRFLELANHLDHTDFDVSRISDKLQNKYSSELGVNNISAAVILPEEAVEAIDTKGAAESSKFSTNKGDYDKSEQELSKNKNIGSRSELGLTMLSLTNNVNKTYIPTRDDRGKEYVKYDFKDPETGATYDLKCVSEDAYGGNIVYIKDNDLDMGLDEDLHYTYDDHDIEDWNNVDKFRSKVRAKPERVEYMMNSFHFEMSDGKSLIIYTSAVSTQDIADTVDQTTYQNDIKFGAFLYPQFNRDGKQNRTIFLTRSYVYDNHLDRDI